METLDDIIGRLNGLSEDVRKEVEKAAAASTKEMPWVPNPGPQMQAYMSEADELLFGGEAGGGKILSKINGLVLTPFGFKKCVDLKIGDRVNAPDGTTSRIIQLHPWVKLPGVKVTFHDGSSTIVAWDHLWLAWRSGGVKKRPNSKYECGEGSAEVIETRELAAWLATAQDQKQRGIRPKWPCIPVCKPQVFNVTTRYQIDLDPYKLGSWLGDGHGSESGQIGITSVDHEHMAREIPEFDYSNDGRHYRVKGKTKKHWRAMLERAGLWGTKAATKFIPRQFLWGGIETRTATLQGLLDTDGTVDERGHISFCSVSKQLADDVTTIVQSLGGTATASQRVGKYRDADGEIVECQMAYNLYIKLPSSIQPFRLKRKLALAESGVEDLLYRRVVSVEEIEEIEGRCITVSHPSGLYLTNDFIVTHNSDLLIGTALENHRRSLILRRFNDDARGLSDRAVEIVGNRLGLNGTTLEWRFPDGRLLEFGGCQHEDDKQRYKGRPHSLIGFDEGADFTKTQYDFITTWCRSTNPGERCRIIVATNPPTTAAGLWIVEYWAAWLDPNHPDPAKPGELRWYFRGDDDIEKEVDGPGPYPLGNDMVRAKSRTFIRSKLIDNPDLSRTDYASTLAALPSYLRDAYRDGRFDMALSDEPNQVIPTAWVREAQERWLSYPPPGLPMTMMGVDASGGGNDPMIIATRYDGWFAKLIEIEGKNIPLDRAGAYCSGAILSHRRDAAPVVLDMGGGYGGPIYEHLKTNDIECIAHNGAKSGTKRTKDRKLGFFNYRAQVAWAFREALDPGQPGGSSIALPADNRLVADLTSLLFEVTKNGIQLEPKKALIKRIGRSTDRGDAVIMCWSKGGSTQDGQKFVPRDQRFYKPRIKVLTGRRSKR